MKIIEMIVSPTGETVLQTRGFAGSSCQQASRFLQQTLGKTADEKLTAEFYQVQPVDQSHQQQI